MNGAYKADFHTPLGRGTGVVFLLEDGRAMGGDSLMYYQGRYETDGDTIRLTGVSPDAPGVVLDVRLVRVGPAPQG